MATKMKKIHKRDIFPDKLKKTIETILVRNEEILYTFRESFNWDIVRTWAVVTSYRLLIVDVLPWRVDVQDFHLKEMNFEYKQDHIGPYDVILFKSKLQDLYDITVLRNRRQEAQEFLHKVSTEVRAQDTYGLRSLEVAPVQETKRLVWCDKHLETLRMSGAITRAEYELAKTNKNICEYTQK
jgi:hypothetical protein